MCKKFFNQKACKRFRQCVFEDWRGVDGLRLETRDPQTQGNEEAEQDVESLKNKLKEADDLQSRLFDGETERRYTKKTAWGLNKTKKWSLPLFEQFVRKKKQRCYIVSAIEAIKNRTHICYRVSNQLYSFEKTGATLHGTWAFPSENQQ